MMPKDLPHWKTVYHYFRVWREEGTWGRINRELLERTRRKQGKDEYPSVGIIDSQSARTSAKGGRGGMMGGRRWWGAKGR